MSSVLDNAALFGAVSAGLSWGVGHGATLGSAKAGLWSNGVSPFSNSLSGTIFKHLAHGVSQGLVSELRGGQFKSGFVGAIAGSIGAGMSARVMGALGANSTVFTRTMTAAVFGGLAAKATGGSFEDGAIAAAFTHLFNQEARTGGSTSVRSGKAGNPISGGEYRKSPHVDERVRGFGYSQLLSKMTGLFFVRFDPVSLRLVPNPVGVAIAGVMPADMGCGIIQCAIDAGTLSVDYVVPVQLNFSPDTQCFNVSNTPVSSFVDSTRSTGNH